MRLSLFTNLRIEKIRVDLPPKFANLQHVDDVAQALVVAYHCSQLRVLCGALVARQQHICKELPKQSIQCQTV